MDPHRQGPVFPRYKATREGHQLNFAIGLDDGPPNRLDAHHVECLEAPIITALFDSLDIEVARETPEDKHPAALYLAQLGPGSRRTMNEALQKIARYLSDGQCDMRSLPWSALRIEHTSALRTRLASELAPATANKHLAALRGVLKQVWRLGQISAEDHQRAIELPAVQGASPRKSRALSQEELRALVAACERDRSPAGPRDAALFALLFGAGLRRAEVAALDLSDFDRHTSTICVRGNGTRAPRRFTANREGLLALEGWLARRSIAPGPLFNPVNKPSLIHIRRCRRIKSSKPQWSPHT